MARASAENGAGVRRTAHGGGAKRGQGVLQQVQLEAGVRRRRAVQLVAGGEGAGAHAEHGADLQRRHRARQLTLEPQRMWTGHVRASAALRGGKAHSDGPRAPHLSCMLLGSFSRWRSGASGFVSLLRPADMCTKRTHAARFSCVTAHPRRVARASIAQPRRQASSNLSNRLALSTHARRTLTRPTPRRRRRPAAR